MHDFYCSQLQATYLMTFVCSKNILFILLQYLRSSGHYKNAKRNIKSVELHTNNIFKKDIIHISIIYKLKRSRMYQINYLL